MAEKNINTLLELLEKYDVEIPIIQRDYAQGRTDQHSDMVRKTLLGDIKKALTKESPQLDLNFVYGKVVSENKFIPVDGQQRLTTLFLLHVFAFRDDTSKDSLLKKFSYETRISSRRFIEALVDKRKQIFVDSLSPSKSPSEKILDSEWFVSSWQFDPTIQSMLVMLDDIKKCFNDVDDLAGLLSDSNNKPLVFQFLDMEELGMEDTLYIKLNARGKPLTEFENFKARLFGRMHELYTGDSGKDAEFETNFKHAFDGTWTDLFWKQFEDKDKFDENYLNFFNVLFMNNSVLYIDGMLITNASHPHWANKFEISKIDTSMFETVYYCLNFLCDDKCDSEFIRNIIKNIFAPAVQNRTSHKNRLMLHALTTYLYKSKGKTESLDKWLRIMQNLIKNSSFDDRSYQRAAKSILKMSDHWQDLLAYFNDGVNIDGFSPEQVNEEHIKAQIISNPDQIIFNPNPVTNNDFKNYIYDAEGHPYFCGQIRSALYLADVGGKYDFDKFKCYWDKIAALFDEKGPKNWDKIAALFDEKESKKKVQLLRRALLSKGDYTMSVDKGSCKTLCVDSSSDTYSLKRLFSNNGKEVKELLDDLNTTNDLDHQLEEIIKKSAISQKDWRYCFIHYPSLFGLMDPNYLRIKKVDVDNDFSNLHYHYHIIIPKKASNGYNFSTHLEALSLAYFNACKISVNDIGTFAERYLPIKDFKVTYNNGAYTITNNKDKTIQTQSDDVITEALGIVKKLLAEQTPPTQNNN